MKIVYLRWVDSVTSSGWQPAPNKTTGLSEIDTVGYLIHEDRKHVEIAHSASAERDEFNGILAIPKTAILKRRTIRLID